MPGVRLVPDGQALILLTAGQIATDAAPVHAVDALTGEPVPGTPVRYWVLDGAMEVADGREAWTVQADDEGRASVALRLAAPGRGLVAAQAADGSGQPLVFAVRTEGMAHEVAIREVRPGGLAPNRGAPGEGRPDAGRAGEAQVRVTVADHTGAPVSGAALIVDASSDAGTSIRGTVREMGGGVYEGVLPPLRPGLWTMAVWERGTRAAAERPLEVLPGPAAQIEVLGDPDPRADPPYDRVTVRARLLDAGGHPLDPSRLVARAGGERLAGGAVGDEARFAVRFAGSGDREVDIEDAASGLRRRAVVPFAPLWLTGRGVVEPGEEFVTGLRALPAAGRAFTRAAVQITFDAERVAWVGVVPPELPGVAPVGPPRLTGNRLELELAAARSLPAEAWPEGLPLGGIRWRCLGEGTTCFQVEGALSPPVPGWMVCWEQKSAPENIRCVCVNIIYRAWHVEDRGLGRQMARQAARAIAGNTYVCCPVLRFGWDHCAITPADYLALRRLWGGALRPYYYPDDFYALFDSGLCQKPDCINLYVFPIGNRNINGVSRASSGTIVIDPERFQQLGNIGAHEFGHIFGLDDLEESFNLMHRRAPHGHYLSTAQCRRIWDTLPNFPCP